jgi:hypothetical protein
MPDNPIAKLDETPRTIKDALRDVLAGHRILASFFEHYASLLRMAEGSMKKRGFVPMGKNPRCYTSCSSWVKLDAAVSAWLPSYVIYGWKKSSTCSATITLRLDVGDIPDLALLVVRNLESGCEDVDVFRDLTWFEPEAGGDIWTRHMFDGESKARYEIDILHLGLDQVKSAADVDSVVVRRLAERYDSISTPDSKG